MHRNTDIGVRLLTDDIWLFVDSRKLLWLVLALNSIVELEQKIEPATQDDIAKATVILEVALGAEYDFKLALEEVKTTCGLLKVQIHRKMSTILEEAQKAHKRCHD